MRLWTAAAFSLALSALAVPASAQVFKCAQAGQTVFSDRPCPDASGAILKASTPGPQGQLDFQVAVRHYLVTAPDYRSAMATLRASKDGFSGWARWATDYKYDSKPAGTGCAVRSVSVTIRGDILMPDWSNEKTATPADQSYWRTMYANLLRHEEGHTQHGREFGMLLKERLLGMGVMPCGEVDARLRGEYLRLAGNLMKRDQDYDARTAHGLRQDNPY
jgi:hypothetical protein